MSAQILLEVSASFPGATGGFDSIRLVRVSDLSSEVFYSGKTLVGTNVGVVLATDSQTALTANYNSGSAKTLLATPVAGGVYKVRGVQAINRVATTSCTFPSLTLSWKDAGGISRTQALVSTSTTNSTNTITTFDYTFHADSSAAITITSAGYASTGATSMRYSLGYTLEQGA